ncbi:MAG: hypothetical protein EA343_19360 [Nodularia sp. (in: Bacteria)]|nr:MAG: hypothetical protein EA343_19360 [Nodularia sp. (in: cyanobacteria)]
MLTEITKSDLFEELSAEKQQLLAGGQMNFQIERFDQFDEEDEFDSPRRGRGRGRDTESRVRSIPIRLTGTLEGTLEFVK